MITYDDEADNKVEATYDKRTPVIVSGLMLLTSLVLALFILFSCSSPEALSGPSEESTSDSEQEQQQSTSSLPDGYYGMLKVSDTNLSDNAGNPVQLKGISSHGLSWFPEYVNYDMMQQAKEEWGINVFRVALYTADYNGYCTGDESNRQQLLAKVDEAVQAAESHNMYVIIDWHILSDSSPLTYQAEAETFFNSIAQKYADKENVIYEICNEPNGDTTWDEVKSYAQTILPIIRQHTDALVLVGTPEWCQRVDQAAAAPLEGFDNIMYTLHFYAATHKDDLRDRMVEATESGLPIFVSEFGICDASETGPIDEEQANLWVEAMDAHNISYVMWNLSNKDESSAMILPSVTKTSDISSEDLSPAGTWFVTRFGAES